MALGGDYSLVILDWMLPKLDGTEVCKRIRSENKHLPILMLTAKTEEFDKVLGLELGADDYMTKPFAARELAARIKALLRRSELTSEDIGFANNEPTQLHFDELEIDILKRKVFKDGTKIDLSAHEFDLLVFLARHPGRPFTREELLLHVWGEEFAAYEHTVSSSINRLRQKLENPRGRPRFVKTVWGVGYRFAERAELGKSSE